MSSERGSSSAPPPPIMGSPLDRRPPAKTLVNRPPHVARTASGGGGLPVRVPRGGRGGEDPRRGGGRVVPARCVGIPEGRGARALRGLRDRRMASVRWTVSHLAGPLRAGSGSGKRGSSSRARGVECSLSGVSRLLRVHFVHFDGMISLVLETIIILVISAFHRFLRSSFMDGRLQTSCLRHVRHVRHVRDFAPPAARGHFAQGRQERNFLSPSS